MSSIRPSILPSAYYPAYFKLDMNIGLSNMNPLAVAIDKIFADFYRQTSGDLQKISPDSFENIKIKETLEGIGFDTEELNIQQRDTLFKQRLELFQSYNKMNAVEQLAGIYFDDYVLRRGYPYKPTRLTGQRLFHFRLLESPLEQKVLFLRTTDELDEKLKDEFIKNCYLFIPHDFSIIVGGKPHSTYKPYNNHIRLNLETKLTQWRL